MNRLSFFTVLIAIALLFSCSQEKVIKLKMKDGAKVEYSASKKYGYSMGILKHVSGEYIQYAVRLNGNGEIMYVYKTRIADEKDDNDEPIAAGPTWYLVSDTTDTLYGAKFFNETILGYYGSTETNFITSNNYKGKTIPYLEEEKAMFVEVAQLMKDKKEAFIAFDSTRNLFWFKYDLQ